MKIQVPRINLNVDIPDSGAYDYPGCLSIWDNIPLKMIVTDLPTDIIAYFYVQCRSSLDSFYVANLEPVNGIEIDVASYLYPLLPAYKDRIAGYTVELGLAHRANQTATVRSQMFRMPVMNIASPNTRYRWRYFDTDFRYAVGELMGKIEPLAHTFDDDFFMDSRYHDMDYDVDVIYRDGTAGNFNYIQGDGISDACQYRRIKIKEPSGRVVVEKYYPEETSICGAITFRWLNSYGSYDAISCNNWSTQPTLQQGVDGGTVTKNEVTCSFPITEANRFALDVLSKSPDVLCTALPQTSGWIKVRCSSTTGVKMTATGLVKTVTLKFQY